MKYIIVTGAYGGMGYATVKALKDKGYFVFAIDRRVGKNEDRVMPIEADLTDNVSVVKAFDAVRKVTDEVYAIVHFAGIYDLDSLIEISEESYKRIFDINVFYF